jgi:hypothetical protein
MAREIDGASKNIGATEIKENRKRTIGGADNEERIINI